MELIYQLLGWAAIGHLLADAFTTLGADKKPFNCNLCLTTWLSLAPFCYQFGPAGILYSALAGVTSELIYKYTQP